MMPRKTKGRQKVEMVKMTKDSNLQVTFSKRRTGLFKKASELSTLCGADIAIVVFSPGNKAFSFGHPNVDSVVDRYFSRSRPPHISSGTMQLMEARRSATVQELNSQLTQVSNQLEKEKKRGEYLTSMMKASPSEWWRKAPVEKLEKPQLEELKTSLEDLKKKLAVQTDKILGSGNSSQPFGAGRYNNNNNNNNLINPNNNVVCLFPHSAGPRQHDPDEFEQKNVLGVPLPTHMMNMNNLNMSLMLPHQFNSFGRGFC